MSLGDLGTLQMEQVFNNLVRDGEVVALLDESRKVIASSDLKLLNHGDQLKIQDRGGMDLFMHGQEQFIASTTTTLGYQGYMGLNWSGHIMRPLHRAFDKNSRDENDYEHSAEDSSLYSQDLRSISKNAAMVTDDLSLVVLNGQIISAKQDAAEFIPVLEEIQNIGYRTQGVFDESISNLYETVIVTVHPPT